MLQHCHNSTSQTSIAGGSAVLASALLAVGFSAFLSISSYGIAQTAEITLRDVAQTADSNRPCEARAFTNCRYMAVSVDDAINTGSLDNAIKTDVAGPKIPDTIQSTDANRPCVAQAFTVCRHLDTH